MLLQNIFVPFSKTSPFFFYRFNRNGKGTKKTIEILCSEFSCNYITGTNSLLCRNLLSLQEKKLHSGRPTLVQVSSMRFFKSIYFLLFLHISPVWFLKYVQLLNFVHVTILWIHEMKSGNWEGCNWHILIFTFWNKFIIGKFVWIKMGFSWQWQHQWTLAPHWPYPDLLFLRG